MHRPSAYRRVPGSGALVPCILVPCILVLGLVLMGPPASAQVQDQRPDSDFTGRAPYGMPDTEGVADPAKAWLPPGSDGTLFSSNDYVDDQGMVGMVDAAGPVRLGDHPFFRVLGPNGRGCVSCHQPAQAMSLAAANARQRWALSADKDPLFAATDGSDCPTLPQADRHAHTLILDRGLIRVALPWPPRDATGKSIVPDFTLAVARDPNGCNSGPVYGPNAARPSISVYRRPRMVANFPRAACAGGDASLLADGRQATLKDQAVDAALTHLEMKTPPSAKQLGAIIAFECQVYIAQSSDRRGWVFATPAGPPGLGPQNIALAAKPSLDAAVFKSFAMWKKPDDLDTPGEAGFRQSVARGAEIFSIRRLTITGAMGLNRDAGAISGTCASCHDIAMTGMATARWIDTGSTNLPWAIPAPDLPLFRITCKAAHPFLGRVIYTQDPGRALVTGRCADVGAITVQQLRGLVARAPYFSNGSARTLEDVVDFYDRRFKAGFTLAEKRDLVNFLSVL